jgi:predicted acetyltransferase
VNDGRAPAAPQVVVPAGEDGEAWAEAVARHFHEDPLDEPTRHLLATVPPARRFVVREDGRIVANAGVLSLDLAVPGGDTLPCAGITMVGVAHTHRRRGLLRALMHRCLEDARERGEPLAGLFASESGIYPRFGFGPSAPVTSVRLERAHARFLDPVDPGLVEAIEPGEAEEHLPAILDGAQRHTPGVVGRTDEMWRAWCRHGDTYGDPGSSPRRLVTVPGRGYAAYRVRPASRDGLPDGAVVVTELLANDAEAEQALWQHVTDVDLTTRAEVMLRPADDPVELMLADPLRVRWVPLSPLYTRLLDVVRCLEAREPAADGLVTLAVDDPLGTQSGTLRLEAADGHLACAWTDARPQLSMPAPVLAGLWLGGHRATRLRDARRLVEHEPGSARRLDSMLATERRPWTPFEF